MKWLIASDIHGSGYYAKEVVTAFEREKADRMLLLGDLLYHGPRNELPREYDPKTVYTALNQYASVITAVRGNCDAEIDQMVLDFPMMSDEAIIMEGSHLIFASHGHVYGPEQMPRLHAGDVLLCGHTHVPACRQVKDVMYLNPGSAAIPKEDSDHGYMTLENGLFVWKNFDGKELRSWSLE